MIASLIAAPKSCNGDEICAIEPSILSCRQVHKLPSTWLMNAQLTGFCESYRVRAIGFPSLMALVLTVYLPDARVAVREFCHAVFRVLS